MHEHPHRPLTPSHQFGHLADVHAGHDPQEHGVGLIRRQAPNEGKGTVEVVMDLELIAGDLQLGERAARILRPSSSPAELVQQAAAGDREQPSPEVIRAAGEGGEVPGDIEPRVCSQVLRGAGKPGRADTGGRPVGRCETRR